MTSDAPLPFGELTVGTRVRVLTNHVCMTAASYDRYFVTEGASTEVVDEWHKATGRRTGAPPPSRWWLDVGASTADVERTEKDLNLKRVFLAIGAIAGWLAGTLVKGGGFGLLGNIIVGIVGAFVGGYLFGALGISTGGIFGSIITATVGAIVLIFVIRVLKKA